jgi:hypothetical protein
MDKGDFLMRLTGLVATAAAVAATLVPVASATQPLRPSATRAIHDTKVEILHQYTDLLDTSRPVSTELMPKALVSCHPLTDTLWRCTWMGKDKHFYTVFGRSNVRFYKYDTDVQLYDVKCYLAPNAPIDFCAYGG